MNPTPRLTFLLSVRNVAATVAATIESILAQTLSDFELLILDDVSTDGTAEVIARYRDKRIRALTNPTHLNHSQAANRGLALARADYVARIDGDDLCLPHRAAIQLEYLDAHPDIAIVGSFIQTFTDDPAAATGQIVQYPLDPPTVSATMLFRNTLAQPAVTLRKSMLSARQVEYDPLCIRAEDYELWGRCVMRGLRMANIPQVLVQYRIHPGQGMVRYLDACNATAQATRKRLIEHLGLRPTPAELTIHEALGLDQLVADPSFISDAAQWLVDLATANDRLARFDRQALMRLLTGRYVTLSRFAARHGLPSPDVSTSPFAPYLHPGVLVHQNSF